MNRSAVTQGFNLKNPLAELSLRDALNSSYNNFWTNKRGRSRKSTTAHNESFQQGQ